MSDKKYIYNPLIRRNLQKVTGGVMPGVEVTAAEINQLQGVTANIQQQLNAIVAGQAWSDISVNNITELQAAIVASNQGKHLRIHLTADIVLTDNVTWNLSNCIIDGGSFFVFYPKTYSITLTGYSAYFKNMFFFAAATWGHEYPIKIKGQQNDIQHFIFENVGFLYVTFDDDHQGHYIECTPTGSQKYITAEILFISPLFTRFPQSMEVIKYPFTVKVNSGHSANYVNWVVTNNRGNDSRTQTSAIEMISANSADSLVCDSSVTVSGTKPAIFKKYGDIAGAISVDSLTTSGNVTAGGNVAVTGNVTAADITASGAINAASLTTTGSITAGGTVNATGNVNVSGDLSVAGTITTVSSEEISTKDDYVYMREENPLAIAAGQFAGIQVQNYDGNNTNSRIVVDHNGVIRGGDVGDEEPLMLRDEAASLNNSRLLAWDSATATAKDSGFAIVQMSVEEYEELVSKDANTIYLLY